MRVCVCVMHRSSHLFNLSNWCIQLTFFIFGFHYYALLFTQKYRLSHWDHRANAAATASDIFIYAWHYICINYLHTQHTCLLLPHLINLAFTPNFIAALSGKGIFSCVFFAIVQLIFTLTTTFMQSCGCACKYVIAWLWWWVQLYAIFSAIDAAILVRCAFRENQLNCL